ncbi:MAG TPA: hypothetical protein VFT35_03230 [Gaiellaceae bacterium]|nr:hypothetical protein [Gaiellaceae bacterium]
MTPGPRRRAWRPWTSAAYGVLGATLLWSRLAELGHSFWTDEILMVSQYVRKGPHEILAGPTLSHELLALLAWATDGITGESEIAFRLWSAVPFIAGVVVVTWWLHVRLGALSGVLFLFLATVSPELLDITRQARGYGLAFLAMSVVVVAALEARRTRRTEAIVAFCVAGVLGTWTLPQTGIAFVVTGAVLLTVRELRRPVALGLALSVAAIVAWYAPHLGAVRSSSQIEDGVQIGFPWVLTAPIDQILLPALLWIDGTVVVAGIVWLPLVLLAVIVAAASPLLHDRVSAWTLCAGVLATIVVLWIGQAYVIPRYLSYLLVPLFVLVATGAASILGRAARREAVLRAVVCLVVLGVLGVRFVVLAPDVVGLPREANRDAAEVVKSRETPTRVLVYARNPQSVGFYLDGPLLDLRGRDVAGAVCGQSAPVFYVVQPFTLGAVDVPCLDRLGVERSHFRQYARGDETDVWLVPPAS